MEIKVFIKSKNDIEILKNFGKMMVNNEILVYDENRMFIYDDEIEVGKEYSIVIE